MVNWLAQIWMIPLVPLAGAALMLLFGRALPRAVVGFVCCATVFVSLILSTGALLELGGRGLAVHEVELSMWIPLLHAPWGFRLDALSGLMALIITGVGLLIHIYSIGYMHDDAGYARYFGGLNLFVFAMLLLVLANNFVLMFAGWEGVGLASYLLIGFWFGRPAAAAAGTKAFLVNRIGDVGLMLAIWLIWVSFGGVRFSDLRTDTVGAPYDWIALLLLIGAIGKSAQFPLHIWLPDAMEGPTPVSALIHAATMVTAGVYLIARCHMLFEAAGRISDLTAVIGAFTAIFAASVALAQHDIKRVLAWSTISQLGYMFLALGVGAYWVAIFHLLTHAFFKALLFLGAGNVIHALAGEQDMRQMGGLARRLPLTHLAMLAGTLSAAGFPGFAGFFSKDEILAWAYGSAHGSLALYITGLVTALLTAFYMGRLMYLVFYGESRSEHLAMHNAGVSMTMPLILLGAGSVFAGWFAVPDSWTFFGKLFHSLPALLQPVFGMRAAPSTPELGLVALSVVAMLAGGWLAGLLHLREWRGGLAAALSNGWYVDRIVNTIFVRGLAFGGGHLLNTFDAQVIDGGVNGAGWLTRMTSRVSIWWDTWIVDGVVRLTALAVKMSSYPVRFTQSGSVQFYALVILAGLIALVGYMAAR